MPIYAYRCESCGHAQDVLQKMSDAALTACPACGADAFRKQVTAAGFQLKGSGWYVTDFRDKGQGKAAKKAENADAKPADATPADAKPADAPSAPASGSGAAGSGTADGGAKPAAPAGGPAKAA